MTRGTGCISIGSKESDVRIHRVIEYIQPDDGPYPIWADIFLSTSALGGTILLLHRGSLDAINETDAAWGATHYPHGADWLTRRTIALHKTSDTPISVAAEGGARIGEQHYRPWKGPKSPTAVVGNKPNANVPFTMWEIGGLEAPSASTGSETLDKVELLWVLRLKLTMTQETFDRHIGAGGVINSYGESILLNKIEKEDLPFYGQKPGEDDAEAFQRHFDDFKKVSHLVPDIFEYVIVAPDSASLGWRTTPFSPNFSPQVISEALNKNTRWFVANHCLKTQSSTTTWAAATKRDHPEIERPMVDGEELERYNGFVLEIVDSAKSPTP